MKVYSFLSGKHTKHRKNIRFTSLFLTLIITALVIIGSSPLRKPVAAAVSPPQLSVLSPGANASIPSSTTLVTTLSGESIYNYDMFWYVDNGSWNWMGNSQNGQNTKQADVNVSGWSWHAPSNLYTISFVAVLHSNGQRIYTSLPIYVGANATSSQSPSGSGTTTTTPAVTLYTDPNSHAAQTAASTTDPTMKRVMTKLAAVPTGFWFGDWNSNVQADVGNVVNAAAAAGKAPILVAYDIPERDCSGYSGGGASSAGAYQAWIQGFASGIGSHAAIVILEPDALAQISCLSSGDQTTRYQLLNFAVNTLKAHSGTKVYLDAGNPQAGLT